MKENFTHPLRAAMAAALTLGLVQALVTTSAIAWLYRDMVLAPYAFFQLEIYDAWTKLALLVAERAGFALTLHEFVGPGILSKLSIATPLVLVNVAVASVAGVVAALVAGACGGRTARASSPGSTGRIGGGASSRRRTLQMLLALIAVELVIHASIYLARVHIPDGAGVARAMANFARDFLSGGTALALVVLAVSGALSALAVQMLRMPPAPAVALAAAVLALPWTTHTDAAPGKISAPAAPEAAAIAAGYNVVFISIDSLRADHVSAYGYGRPTTPTIDRWARDGVRFQNASSTTSWTLPSHMSMMTGRSLLSHGVVDDDRSLPPAVPTIAETLRGAGYRTGAVVAGPYLNSRYGFAKGFDHYDDHTVTYEAFAEHAEKTTSPLVEGAASAWLDANAAAAPFFLFLHFWDVHYDYTPPPPYDSMFDPDYRGTRTGRNFYFDPAVNRDMDQRDIEHLKALYDGEIRYVDDHLAKVEAKLAELGVRDRTIIVLTADHGDEFFEHGNKGHHRTLYDEVIRVPLVILVPGAQPAAGVVTSETSIIDIFPTVLSLLGIQAPAGIEGEDLAPVAFGGAPQRPRTTLAELYRAQSMNMQASLRDSNVKVTQHFKYWLSEAYDVRSDRGEQRRLPVGSTHAAELSGALAARLNRAWLDFRGHARSGSGDEVVLDAQAEESLRALGYLQ